jgi:hypothetical protein
MEGAQSDNATPPDGRPKQGSVTYTLTWGRSRLRVPKLPAMPRAIRAIKDGHFKQSDSEVWSAAGRLSTAIQIAQLFLTAHEMGHSIDDPTQQAIQRLFPELATMQRVLDYMMGLQRVFSPDAPEPSTELQGLLFIGSSGSRVGNFQCFGSVQVRIFRRRYSSSRKP